MSARTQLSPQAPPLARTAAPQSVSARLQLPPAFSEHFRRATASWGASLACASSTSSRAQSPPRHPRTLRASNERGAPPDVPESWLRALASLLLCSPQRSGQFAYPPTSFGNWRRGRTAGYKTVGHVRKSKRRGFLFQRDANADNGFEDLRSPWAVLILLPLFLLFLLLQLLLLAFFLVFLATLVSHGCSFFAIMPRDGELCRLAQRG